MKDKCVCKVAFAVKIFTTFVCATRTNKFVDVTSVVETYTDTYGFTGIHIITATAVFQIY